MLASSGTTDIRQFVDSELEDATTISKEEQTIVGMRHQQMTHSVVFARDHAGHAPSATPLGTIGAGGQALDVALLCQGNNNLFVRDEVFVLKVSCLGFFNFCAPLIAVFLFEFFEIVLNDLTDLVDIAQQQVIISNILQDLVQLVFNFLTFQGSEAGQAHIEDSFRLLLREAKTLA